MGWLRRGLWPGPFVGLGLLLICAVALAAEGDLDASFSGDGKVTTPIGSSDDYATALAIDAHGRIVAAGASYNGTDDDFALVRYLPGGGPDPSFSGDGKLTTPIGASDEGATAVAIDSQDRPVLAGYSYTGSAYVIALARYLPGGGPDPSFSGDGKLTTALGGIDDEANAVAIDAKGRIVVAGDSNNGSDSDFALVRYLPGGGPDPSFSGDGKLTTPIGDSSDGAAALAIDAKGRIVVAGSSFNGADNDFALVRYLPNGKLDTSFSGDGKLTTPIGSSDDYATALAIDAKGRIVVAGFSYKGTGDDFAVARYLPSGKLDTAFSRDGKLTTPIGSDYDKAWAVAVDAQGRVVVGGQAANGATSDFALARYLPNGNLDTSFNGNGKLTTSIGSSRDFANALAIDAKRRIVLAGSSYNGTDEDFALARYAGDQTAPKVRITRGPAAGGFTSDSTPTFRFAADEPSVTFACRFDGDPFGRCGHHRATADALDDGSHVFRVRGTDPAANVGALTRRFKVDTKAPDPTITGRSTFTTRRSRGRAKFKLAAGEGRAKLACRIDGGRFKRCGAGRYKTPKLGVGKHVVAVRSTDRAGNRGTAKKRFSIVRK